MDETQIARGPCRGPRAGETRADVSAPSAENEELNRKLDSLPSDRARKFLLLRERMAGRLTLEEVDEIFRARPELVTA
jgi:hypothetical protein